METYLTKEQIDFLSDKYGVTIRQNPKNYKGQPECAIVHITSTDGFGKISKRIFKDRNGVTNKDNYKIIMNIAKKLYLRKIEHNQKIKERLNNVDPKIIDQIPNDLFKKG